MGRGFRASGYALFWLALSLGFALPAKAEPPPAHPIQLAPRVSYEQQRIDRVLAEQKLVVDGAPQGKRITFVRIVRDDVFVRDEVWPLWFNWFHGLTRENIVRRELLFAEGNAYEDARIEETMRNLRGMGIFALVRIVAVQGTSKDEVGVLVHTRDLWSLRLETDLSATSKVLNSFVVRGTERNVFGRNQAVGVDFNLIPQSYQVAEDYYARRLFQSSVAFKERAGLVFNRFSGRREGGLGSVSVGQPYYRLSQRFAWDATVLHDQRIARNASVGEVAPYPTPRSTDAADAVYAKQAYWLRQQRGRLLGFWRRGDIVKHTLGAGWDYRSTRAHPIAESELPDSLYSAFVRDVLPARRTDSGPTITYEMFVARWATFVNLATYGQSENVRIGPALALATRVPIDALGSTFNAWVIAGDAALVLAPRGFLVDLRAGGSMRLQQQHWIDRKATFQIRGATPVFSIFRFVVRSYLELRHGDTQKTYVTLGGDNALRGYPAQYFHASGADRFLANFELRTLPIEWEAVHVGAVLFYDVGSVFSKPSAIQLNHGVGIGIRLLFPQFNRTPFTFDGGTSFNREFPVVPTIAAGQVVPLTAAEDAE